MGANAVSELLPGFEVIDVHAHLEVRGYGETTGSVDEIRRLLDRAGFSKVILSSLRAIAYDTPAGNAAVARAVESDPRIYGSVVFNAAHPAEAREQIARYGDAPRFVSAKNYPSVSGLPINSRENFPCFEMLAAKKLPVTFHSWSGDGPAAEDAARRFPQLRFVWFHALANNYRKAAELARSLPNVVLEFVTSTQERGKVEHLVSQVGADRVVFGTDQALFDPIRQLGSVLEARLSDDDRRKVLALTARQVFNFDRG